MDKTYSIAALKAGLSSILMDVEGGDEVLVTAHNRPVARLTSVRRLPPLPRCELARILACAPLPLRRGAVGSGELIRTIRDEEDH